MLISLFFGVYVYVQIAPTAGVEEEQALKAMSERNRRTFLRKQKIVGATDVTIAHVNNSARDRMSTRTIFSKKD